MSNKAARTGTKNAFSEDEDRMLVELVKLHGEHCWHKIAEEFSCKTGKQCRNRWYNYANPTIQVKDWTQEEDDLLKSKIKEIGQKWTALQTFFPSRSPANIRYRWLKLSRVSLSGSKDKHKPKSKNGSKHGNKKHLKTIKKQSAPKIVQQTPQGDLFDSVFKKVEREMNYIEASLVTEVTDPFMPLYY